MEVKNIAAWRGFDENTGGNDVGGGNALIDPAGSGQPYKILATIGGTPLRQRQFTDEFQLTAKTDWFNFVAGTFYFVENAKGIPSLFNQFSFSILPDRNPPAPSAAYQPLIARNASLAAFMQSTFHLTNQLDVTGGARITRDTRYYRDVTAAAPTGIAVRRNFDHVDWIGNVTYHPSTDIMVYAKIATGYIAGGIRSAIPFDPETLISYEVGAKADLLDRRLRINAAAYTSDYKNLQVTLFENGVTFIENAGRAKIKGFEVEVTAVPTDWLTIGGNLGHTNFQFKEYVQVIGGVRTDVADRLIPTRRPRWTGMTYGQIAVPIDGLGKAGFRLDATYQGETRLSSQTPYASAALNDLMTLKPFWIVNARASLNDFRLGALKASISAFVQNLNNKKNLEFASDIGSVIIGTFRQPRSYGLDMTVEF